MRSRRREPSANRPRHHRLSRSSLSSRLFPAQHQSLPSSLMLRMLLSQTRAPSSNHLLVYLRQTPPSQLLQPSNSPSTKLLRGLSFLLPAPPQVSAQTSSRRSRMRRLSHSHASRVQRPRRPQNIRKRALRLPNPRPERPRELQDTPLESSSQCQTQSCRQSIKRQRDR